MNTTHWRKLRRWGLLLGVGYILLGFFAVPYLLRSVVLWQLPKQIGRPVNLAQVDFNPFTGAVTLKGFAIREPDGQPFLSWDSVFVNVDPTALVFRRLVLPEVVISNAAARVERKADGIFNFADILNRFPSAPPPAAPTRGKPVVVKVGELKLIGCQLHWRDLARPTPFITTLGPIDVTLREFSTDPANKNPYHFSAITESDETISWAGHFSLNPIRSDGEFAIENISLRKYAPYYDELVNLQVHTGQLDVRANYRVELTDRLNVAQVSNLTARLRELGIGPRQQTNTLIAIPELTVSDTACDAVAQTVNVGSVHSRGARFQVERLTNGTFNLLGLVAGPTATAAPSTNTTPSAPWTAIVGSVVLEDWGVQLTGIFGQQQAGWNLLTLNGIRTATEPLSIAVDSVALTNARVFHTDTSVQPTAELSIPQLNLTIRGFSTASNTVAELAITGQTADRGQFQATGHINPFSLDATTRLQVQLSGLDLVPPGPYAGKYAGYLVRAGRLNVDLQYDIQQRNLKAANKITVDQFNFGEAVNSPDAVKLPVKLAVAILKDRQGRISLDIPVEGRVDDPKFRYWGAVWTVLGNLFTKIVTAPFSLLGSMVGGGGEELGYLEFTPGSAELVPDGTKKLDILIKALTERPALNLEITGSIDPERDNEPLRRQKLMRQLLTTRAQRENGNTNALTAVEYTTYLREAYAAALLQLTPTPPAPPKFTTNIDKFSPPGSTGRPSPLTPSQAKREASLLNVAEIENRYLPWLELTAEDYRQLTDARAANVASYLALQGEINRQRLLLNGPTAPIRKDGSRVIFSLQ